MRLALFTTTYASDEQIDEVDEIECDGPGRSLIGEIAALLVAGELTVVFVWRVPPCALH